MKKRIFSLILLLFALKTMASGSREKEIDSILNQTKELHVAAKMAPQLESAMKALDLSIEYGYDEGKAKAHFWAADALLNIGLFKEAFSHLQQIQTTDYYKKKTFLQSETHRLKGRVYLGLGLLRQAIREFHVQIAASGSLKGEIQSKSYLHAYGNLSTAYDWLGQPDSVLKYSRFQLDLLPKFHGKDSAMIRLGVYDDLGTLYTKKGDFAKAKFYLGKSLELIEQNKIPIYFNTYTYLGNLEQEKGNIKEALPYFFKSLANMKAVGDRNAMRDRYRFLGEYYEYYNLGDHQASKYHIHFKQLKDSLEKENKQILNIVLNQILKSKDVESATKVSKSVAFSIMAVLMLVIVITFFLGRSRHNRKVLAEKEGALQETENTNRALTEQIGENKFNNLVDLAKSNNPEFLILFSDLYPDFIKALKNLDANMRSTELEFCAMAFLNFSTKNISEYTFVTIRAVQVRKNRLRKKFDIPSEVDFNNWMRELVDKIDQPEVIE
ncbi:tetratricopeptide repeat protein [uncultured Sphingobacterium sp.]|uniref:tetratricopeptide repeat protein n=1 Tax=uncultured Sphingobacterium sp. TaxID=182688 RepID=UPI003748D457